MSLDNYTNLQAEIASWLNRTDLTTTIPTLITLAEATMKRRLRRSSTRTTITISAEETTLPADCAELRSIYFESASANQDLPLKTTTPEGLAEIRARMGGVVSRPVGAAFMAGKLVVAPSPDQSYTARIFYYTQLTPLSGSVATNTVLTEAPDAYLFGALLMAEPFLEHDERIPTWKALFDAAIDELNDVRTREEYGNGIRDMRLPRVFD